MRKILSLMLLFSFHVGLVFPTGVEVESDTATQVESQLTKSQLLYKCTYGCKDTNFETWQKLMFHNFKTHKGEYLYVCHCGKSYKKRGVLIKHLNTHKGVYACSCQYNCGYGSVHKKNVHQHEKTCTMRPDDAPEVFKYHCQYSCGYEYVRKANVSKHEMTCLKRPDDAPELFKYPCQYNCGYRSVHRDSVTTHKKTCKLRPADAPNVFKYPCQYNCGYKSVWKGSVVKHETTCKLRPGGSQVTGSKRKNDGDDQADPRKRRAL